MAILAKVIGKGYYARNNEGTYRVPVGTEIVVRGIPASMKNKLEKVKDVPDSKLVVNDTPEAAKHRAEGNTRKADALTADAKEKMGGKKKAAPKKADEQPEEPAASAS